MKYYLLRGNQIVTTLDTSAGDIVALPLLGGGDAMSLMSQTHAANLMANLNLTAVQALAALGVADLSAGQLATVFVGSNPVAVPTSGLAYYKLIDIGAYSLWQVNGQAADLLSLHNALYSRAPLATLGLLAVVQTPGSQFYPTAMRTATGMTGPQALARRDRIAVYLESLGKTATALRAATDEHAQMLGIVTALGYTAAQLWAKMVTV